MGLQDQIATDLMTAMKSRDTVRVSTLRLVKSAVGVKEIAKQKTLTEPEFLDVIQSEAKRRREAIDEFAKVGRQDLADKEKAELDVLQSYLPAMMSETELRALVEAAVKSSGAKTPQDMGKVMGVLMPQIKGRADGKQAQQIVQSLLKP